MTVDELLSLTQAIVAEAYKLSVERTGAAAAPVNYACIFAQSVEEYEALVLVARQLGPIVKDTAMGPVFLIPPRTTEAGPLRLLKIRRPDPKRQERGDADFTIADFETFKQLHVHKPGFSLIRRPEMEMIELVDPAYDALAYYSHPTLAEVLDLPINR